MRSNHGGRLSPHLCGAISLAVCLLSAPALAQFRTFGPSVTRPTDGFIPAPRELRRELDQAREDLQASRYVDAIARLDLILGNVINEDEEFAEDYLVKGADGTFESLRTEALRLIGSLGPDAQQAYELQLGTDARVALQQALQNQDHDALATIARRFAGTRGGQDAAMLLGRVRLQEGRPLEAALQWQRLYENQAAKERFGSELSLLLATAYALSGQLKHSTGLLQALSTEDLAKLNLGGDTIKPPAGGVDLAWLSRYTGRVGVTAKPPARSWEMFGGDAARVATSDAGMPLRRVRWKVDFAYRSDEEESIRQFEATRGQQAAAPTLHPLVTNGWVLMRSSDQLWGVNLATGKREWYYPWASEEHEALGASGAPFTANSGKRDQLLKSRVWQDALYGQLSSDGESVFLLNRLGGSYSGAPGQPPPHNELVCLGLRREGYTRWVVGGDNEQFEPRLKDAFFLGAPLPVGDTLYCAVEQNNEIRLVALARETGKLRWSQQISQVEEGRMVSLAGPRRQAGLTPVYANGILICPTSVGGIVALDVDSRAFLWGFRYQAKSRGARYGSRATEHWRDNWAVITDGKVVVTPYDADVMQCLDLLTGKPLWERARPRGSDLFVAGVEGNGILVVGKTRFGVVDLATGDDAWEIALDGRAAGRGVHAPGSYLLATTEPALVRIDLAAGEVVEKTLYDEPLGNLVAFEDQLIAQSPTRVRAFYQRDKLRARVEQTLASNAKDPWALEHQAILLLEEGRREDSLVRLRSAIAAYPNPMDALAAKQLLLSTSLELLRENRPGAIDLAAEVEPLLAEFPSREDEFLRVMTVNLQKAGRLEAAFRKSLDLFLSSLPQGNAVLGTAAELKPVSKSRKVRTDRWHRSLFHDLWVTARPEQQEVMRKELQSQLASLPEEKRERLLTAVQDTGVGVVDQLLAIRAELDAGQVSPVAERQLVRWSNGQDQEIAGQATALLARMYRQAQRYPMARRSYRKLEEQFADELVWDALTGRQLVEEDTQVDDALRQVLTAQRDWPTGALRVQQIPRAKPRTSVANRRSNYDRLNGVHVLRTEDPLQVPPPGWTLVYDDAGHSLQGRDSNGQVHRIADLANHLSGLRRTELDIACNGHLIVAARRGSVVAINGLRGTGPTDDAILWTDRISSNSSYSGSGNGPPVHFGETGLKRTVGAPTRKAVDLGTISDRGVVFRRYRELICLDPATGERMWVRNDIPMGAEVWGNDEVVIVHAPGSPPGPDRNARLFSILDGRELASRPVADQRSRIRMFGHSALTWTYDLRGPIVDDPHAVLTEILRAENNIENIRKEKPPEDAVSVLLNRIQVNDLLDQTNPFVWAETFELGAKAVMVGERDLAVFEPETSRFRCFNILTGETHIDAKLEVGLPRVDRMHVERRAGRYLLRLGAESNGRVQRKVRFQTPNAVVKLQNMEIHAFDEAGNPSWQQPVRLANFMPADYVGEDVPALVFLRRVDESSSKKKLQTLILDARTGAKIFDETLLHEGGTFQVRADQEKSTIELHVPATGGSWQLQFTEEASAAATEPYQQPADQPRGLVGSLLKAITTPFGSPESKEEE